MKNDAFFKKCALYGDVGFGEAYVDGDWDTDDVTKVIEWMILNVSDANEGAIRLYHDMGYRDYDRAMLKRLTRS